MIFGLPGVQIMDVFDALHGHAGIRIVTVRPEQATTTWPMGMPVPQGKVGVGLVVPGPAPLTPWPALVRLCNLLPCAPGQRANGELHLGQRRGASTKSRTSSTSSGP